MVCDPVAHNRKAECKRQMGYNARGNAFPPFTDEQSVRQLKRWLLVGMAINSADPTGKQKHYSVDARYLGPHVWPDGSLENLDVEPVLPA
jgi:hypothetical protein